MMSSDHLEKELEWFNSHRAELLAANKGRWVAVYQQELLGIFDTFAEAYRYAVKTTQTPEVLVKQILAADDILDISINYRLGLLNAYHST